MAPVGLRKPTQSKSAKAKGSTRAMVMKSPAMKAEDLELLFNKDDLQLAASALRAGR